MSSSRLPTLLGLVLLCFGPLPGCGPKSVPGGTVLSLRTEGGPIGDIEVAVFREQSGRWVRVASGVTRPDGSAGLLLPDGRGPAYLEAGDYRATLESVGPEPVHFPKEFSDPETTPLRFQCTSDPKSVIELLAPVPEPGLS